MKNRFDKTAAQKNYFKNLFLAGLYDFATSRMKKREFQFLLRVERSTGFYLGSV